MYQTDPQTSPATRAVDAWFALPYEHRLPGDARRWIDRYTEALDVSRGRGLAIIDRLATRWGTVATTAGKNVWFELGAAS